MDTASRRKAGQQSKIVTVLKYVPALAWLQRQHGKLSLPCKYGLWIHCDVQGSERVAAADREGVLGIVVPIQRGQIAVLCGLAIGQAIHLKDNLPGWRLAQLVVSRVAGTENGT
jgi:hypothetical protein